MKFKNKIIGSVVETKDEAIIESYKSNPDYEIVKEPKKKK